MLETTVQFLDDSTERFELAIENVLSELFVRTREISAGLVNPHQQLIYKQDKLNASARAWHQGLKGLMKYKADEIQKASLALEGVSYQRMLDRGFALVSDEEGPIVSAMAARPGVNINIQFYNGNVRATVDTTNNGGSKREKIPKPKHGGDNSQGNLI